MLRKIDEWFRGNNKLGTMTYNYEDGDIKYRMAKYRCEPFFRWYDLWVGIYVDKANRHIYVCPIPCCGFKIGWF